MASVKSPVGLSTAVQRTPTLIKSVMADCINALGIHDK